MTERQQVRIRPAKTTDFKAISDSYWSDPEVPWDIYSHPKLLRRYVGQKGFLVAEVGGRVVGFVHFSHFRKRPWFDPRVKNYGQILELHIKRPFQRLGIGRELMRRAVAILEGEHCSAIYNHTDETNAPALKLYRKLGFKPYLKTLYLKRKGPRRGLSSAKASDNAE